jgi:hypothetical protein
VPDALPALDGDEHLARADVRVELGARVLGQLE